MSDVDIEIRDAIEFLRREKQAVTVESVQQLLKSSPLEIETVPAEWIMPYLEEANVSKVPFAVGEQVRITDTPFIGTVEVVYLNFEDSGFTAYSVRMPRSAIEQGFDDLEIFDERLVTCVYQYAIGQTVYTIEDNENQYTVIDRNLNEVNTAVYLLKRTQGVNQFWLVEYDITLTPVQTLLDDALLAPAPLVECPTCHVSVYKFQLLSSESDQVCEVCARISAGFSFAETQNTFYAVWARWHEDTVKPVDCVIFYRTRTDTRIPGYAYVVYQQPSELDKLKYGSIVYVAFEQTLDAVFQKLKVIGCGATKWRNLSQDSFHRYMSHKDCNALWQVRAYGVVKEVGVFDALPEPDLSVLEQHPF